MSDEPAPALRTLAHAAAAIPADRLPYHVALRHGSMSLGLYAPRGTDPQEPHEQDEIYIVAKGRGTFVRADERFPFAAGDALFVAAGVPHRFEDFTDDLEVWVVFYGPNGGEPA